MTTTVKYAEQEIGPYQLYRRPVKRRGILQLAPGQGADGYGRKIHTDFILQFKDENGVPQGKKYRVYCVCFSNAGSNYILVKGQALYIRDYHSISEIPDEPEEVARQGIEPRP